MYIKYLYKAHRGIIAYKWKYGNFYVFTEVFYNSNSANMHDSSFICDDIAVFRMNTFFRVKWTAQPLRSE